MKALPRGAIAKLFDVIVPTPLLVLYAVEAAVVVPQVTKNGALLATSFHPMLALATLTQIATLSFAGLQAWLFIIRRLPVAKSSGAMPRLVALVGSNMSLLFLAIPSVRTPFTLTVLSLTLIFTGTIASIYIGAALGRSFSILPQARGLITNGPYQFTRHPLYLAELAAVFGYMLQFVQPWSLLIALAALLAQLARIHYEEKILTETYPSYRSYMATTPRLIPRLALPASLFASAHSRNSGQRLIPD